MKTAPFHMPTEYPNNGPLYWRNEQSGVLRSCVARFLNDSPALTADDLQLIREYIIHWIKCPTFRWTREEAPKKKALVARVESAKDRKSIYKALHELLDFGIDPL